MTRMLTAALLLTLLGQAAAQTTDQTTSQPPVTQPLPATNIAAPIAPPAPTLPPTPPVAPLSSRLYAGVSFAPSLSGAGTAYGIVVGSSQVFGSFGAQAAVDYVTSSGALSVDALLLYRPQFGGKLRPYLGAGLGLTSSTAAASTIPTTPVNGIQPAVQTATDYAALVALGSDYLLTDSIVASAEIDYRSPFSSMGTANGAGLRGRLGLKFLF
ncbi:hypothetical protein GCM10022631_01380 [Deinococcus rubellus]|uniref:Outer membrane protein beta-barrel domain-containing protein n=1 Tax=Deinococcus rubellus TaxID=1889240 RepID=A0ABY5YP81_9DEIO|nr:hypothetical protein [Deinococcus rubellus]UWX65528.1 hypothetical protein N0D28_07730 [Deinococcus rubellus]